MSRRQPTTLADCSFRAILADLADLDAEIDAARRGHKAAVALAARLAAASSGANQISWLWGKAGPSG
jgi:hypothetical protein